MNENQTNPRRFWPRHISGLTIVLAILTVITFVAISSPGRGYPIMMGISGGVTEFFGGREAVPPMTSGAPMMDQSVSNKGTMSSGISYPYPYPYPNPDAPITDTREFLKIYYNASMLTRDPQDLTRRVETIVRGYAGRIDAQSSSAKYGYVSFAVPQSKYDAFRAELESLVGSKFLTINISSQNLLPQKLSIEEQQKQADANLATYKTERQKIVSNHTATVKSYQTKIDADTAELTALRAQTQTPQVLAQIQTVSDDLKYYQKLLVSENASYTSQLSSADWNIKNAEDWQKAVQTQDKALLDNVATVNGTVSIQWISFWDILQLYLPGYWIPFIFAVLTVLSFIRDRRRFGTV